MENNMSKKGVHMLKRLWYAFFFCSCIYFHGNIQAACLNSILTNYPNIILLFALSLGKVYVCLDFVQVKYRFTFLFFQNFRDTLKLLLVESRLTKSQVISNEIKNKSYKHQEDVKLCHSLFEFQMVLLNCVFNWCTSQKHKNN